jgi:DNA-binding NtrC family response regulator
MASVLIIDDEAPITASLGLFFERGGHSVHRAHTGAEGVALFRRVRPDLVLLDLRLGDMTGFEVLDKIREYEPVVIMMTGHGDVQQAVEAMQLGAENFLTKPIELDHLSVVAERALEKARLRQMSRYLNEKRTAGIGPVLLGSSPMMREINDQITLLAASSKTTVLLLGENGAGKGRVAEMIHSMSPRASQPFVQVNCAALTAASLDTELFGEERESGGPTRPGLFDVASGGTIFLDEIGDLAPALQPKLLNVLAGKGFRRAGGTQEVSVDVRVLAATHKDLVGEVTAGNFREDLYYRLSVMPVALPPLRARVREDLVELIANVIEELHGQLPDAPAALGDGALEHLLRYPWPGNVRELRNVLERAMIMARGAPRIEPHHLPSEVRSASGADVEHHVPRSLEDVERTHIDRTLRAHKGNRTHAAQELGISRATLIKKIKTFQLEGDERPQPKTRT